MKLRTCLLSILAFFGFGMTSLAVPRSARAAVYNGNPSTYESLIGSLAPGDTLYLASGTYSLLTLQDVHGTPSAWITVTGPASGPPAVIQGNPCCNTVQLYGCSYLAIKNLTIDGLGYDVDGVNAKGYITHDILLEGCQFINFGNNQGTVAISTKETAWNWTIRHNSILEAGTGIYLGNSAGDAPFVNGVIEGNYIKNPTGYCMEIKWQLPYSQAPGMPDGPNRTIIRNNVFIKDDRPSPAGDRPNLLVGPFPTSGFGSSDLYEIYGNLLYNNPRESLFQGSGRMTVHDNILVAPGYAAIYLADHDGPLVYATVYNNTIYGPGDGIGIGNTPREYGLVVGNMVFADRPIYLCGSCSVNAIGDNVTSALANAGQYVNQPSTVLGSMDFYPRSDCAACAGAPLSLSPVMGDRDFSSDFNGTSKGSLTYRGAYAGSGTNSGWRLQDGFKVGGPSSGSGPADVTPPSPPLGLRTR